MEFSEIFATFIVSSCVALILASMRLCYKSKCKTVDMCCIKIVRDIEAETELELNNPIQSQPSPNTPRQNTRLNL